MEGVNLLDELGSDATTKLSPSLAQLVDSLFNTISCRGMRLLGLEVKQLL